MIYVSMYTHTDRQNDLATEPDDHYNMIILFIL